MNKKIICLNYTFTDWMKGPFLGHIHSNEGRRKESDLSIDDYLKFLEKVGYANNVLAMAEHPTSTSDPREINSDDKDRIIKEITHIHLINQQKLYRTSVFSGLEVDFINTDGRFSLPDDILAKVDYAIISLHNILKDNHSIGGNNLSAREITHLYNSAMYNRLINVLGHPTRYLSLEKIREIDWNMIFSAAKRNNIAVEINYREPMLNLYPEQNNAGANAYMNGLEEVFNIARRIGVKFFIGFDIHNRADFIENSDNGVLQFKKCFLDRLQRIFDKLNSAGLIKEDIINSSYENFINFINLKPRT
ncbi:MAG: hypothetical protein ABIH39_03590 [Candidatus Margulisiibacteriota bacterium]